VRKLIATRRRRVALALVTTLITASAAWAAWTIISSNSPGAGRTASLQAPTVVAPTDTELAGVTGVVNAVPGGAGDIVVKVSNPNSVPLTYLSATDNGAPISTDDSTACPTANLVKQIPSAAGTGTGTVASGATSFVLLKSAYALTGSAPNGCQSRRVNVQYNLTWSS
jgi:hypothetical protein